MESGRKRHLLLLDKHRKEPKPDQELARKWENERSRKQVYLHQPTINGTVSGTINGAGTVGTINGTGTISGGTFGVESFASKKKEIKRTITRSCRENKQE